MCFGTAIPRFESWRPSQSSLEDQALKRSDKSDTEEQNVVSVAHAPAHSVRESFRHHRSPLRTCRKLDALFTRRQDGWGARDDISSSPHLVAAFSAGRIKLRMWRLSAWDCWMAGGDGTHLTGGESRDHAALKAAAALAMISQGADDADLEIETVSGRADVYSASHRWIVECGNTRFSKLRQAVMHDSGPRFTLIPYQATHFADGTPRRLIAVDFEWSRDLTADLQAEDWAVMQRIADILELDDLPEELPAPDALSGRA